VGGIFLAMIIILSGIQKLKRAASLLRSINKAGKTTSR